MSSIAQEVEVNKSLGGKKRSTLDKVVLVVAVVEPLSTLPQVYEVWLRHNTAGVSALTWFLYVAIEFIWLAYGIKQKDRQIIIGSLLWAIVELAVAIGAAVK